MSIRNATIAAAIGSLLAVGTAGAGTEDAKDSKIKCYGVTKAGQNDCATSNGSHSCAGQAKKDNDPNEWQMKTKADCEKAGGKVGGPAKGM